MTAKTRSVLSAEVVRILRQLRALPPDDREHRTMHFRDLAETLVSLREHFVTKDGYPDWTGRTWSYRAAVNELYTEAGVKPGEMGSLQSAVRYHAGNVLRDRLPASELERLGITPTSPSDRVRTASRERTDVIAAIRGDADDKDTLRLIMSSWATLSQVETPVQALSAKDRRRAETLLGRIVAKADELRGG